ncbi:MAG: diacylglycerol kinase family protein [Actinomycetota bacterium]|nr:MAG: diacylglycerol kinase catalytic [Actinomycetota bacterium]MDO8950165.1 diacylglycerol kinase family protein [Actinomycetota bacterium]MDP3630486.1 diacylglycerol kinase family protein [Actinomycetota bacterium]
MNILMIANMRSGLGDPGLYDFVRELGEHGAEVTLRFLREDVDLGHLLRDATGYDRVVASGGDGTVSSVVYALRNTGIPVMPYPAGTANLIAHNLNMPTEPVELARLALEGTPVALDIGELDIDNGVGFLMVAGAGFDADLVEKARDLKPIIGEGAYLLAAIQNLQPTMSTFFITLDGTQIVTEGIAVMLVNLARIQFDLSVTHGSDAQDGLLEVVVVKTRSVAGLLPAVWAALLDRLGDHAPRPGLEIHSAREISIRTEPPLPVQADGDLLASRTPISARVLPGAALMVLPADALPRDAYATSE